MNDDNGSLRDKGNLWSSKSAMKISLHFGAFLHTGKILYNIKNELNDKVLETQNNGSVFEKDLGVILTPECMPDFFILSFCNVI